VIGNIRQSYPVGWLIAALLTLSLLVTFLLRNQLFNAVRETLSFRYRSAVALAFIVVIGAGYGMADPEWRKFSKNEYANELAGNGIYEFGNAFWNNELDYFRFYRTMPDKEAFSLLRKELGTSSSKFISDDVFDIEREVNYGRPEKKMNVVLISVESLSAGYLNAFGGKYNITPKLDSLARQSMFFTNLYASGTRTVRGLEALSLSIPPTPGQSIVKRPGNEHLFSLGSVFKSKGYITQYIYGGDSYFDNMDYFFSNNSYDVIDRDKIPANKIHYANIWGVADEDLFTHTLSVLDSNYQVGKPFFSHIMTVSNHRPFTYPDGRIDIPSASQSREGGVKYTDYCIGKFLSDAERKPWFRNTIFVIVADHCAGSAGSVELPVTGYHIPMLIYSPGNIQPREISTVSAQIDIAPTILGMLNFRYKSKFFGRDIFDISPGSERAFISTYQGLGFIRSDRVVIQSPMKKIQAYVPDFVTGKSTPVAVNDTLVKQAIAWYQCASWLIRNKKYNSPSVQ
jgi:phosphoglycerol transferase MdoB-like AlkP superfamily enzyme